MQTHLDLEDRESIQPGNKPGEGGLSCTTHADQQQVSLEFFNTQSRCEKHIRYLVDPTNH